MKTFCVYIIFLTYGFVNAMTDEEVMLKFARSIMQCNSGNIVPMTELLKLQNLEVPTKPETKCLLACAYKDIGTLKENGKFDMESSQKLAKEVAAGDEQRLQNGLKLADICLKVNDAKVNDGEKGCDRAALMYQCALDNAPKLGFKIKFDASKILS